MFVTPGYAQEAAPVEGEVHGDAHTEVPGGEHGSSGFPPFDPTYYPSQLLWLAIVFGLFYLFLSKVVLPRLGHILEVRRDRIAQDLDTAARMKEEADAAVAAYEQELTDARARANGIGQEARDRAKSEADAGRREIEASLDQKLAEAESRIASIKQSAMSEVGTIAEEAAAAIVEQLGGRADRATIANAVAAQRS